MKKLHAINLLGGTPATCARAIGVTASAVHQWPDELPSRIEDRVLAALARKHLPPELLGGVAAPAPPPAAGAEQVPAAADAALSAGLDVTDEGVQAHAD